MVKINELSNSAVGKSGLNSSFSFALQLDTESEKKDQRLEAKIKLWSVESKLAKLTNQKYVEMLREETNKILG
ncbi:MAG TPA: hypothetical protein PKL31_04130 [Fulvivirga sp.]|nr:hypothetical protein [Fulvivirga sp.]